MLKHFSENCLKNIHYVFGSLRHGRFPEEPLLFTVNVAAFGEQILREEYQLAASHI
jgi:hypothetical protein